MIFIKETWFLSMELETFKLHLVKLWTLGSVIMMLIIIINVKQQVTDFYLSHEIIIEIVTM